MKKGSLARTESQQAIEWAKLAREGHDIAWEFLTPGGAYTGRMLIDGEICTPSEATKKLLQSRSDEERSRPSRSDMHEYRWARRIRARVRRSVS